MTRSDRTARLALGLAAMALLSGCGMDVSRLRDRLPFAKGAEPAVAEAPATPAHTLDPTLSDGSQSQIITDLLRRDTVLRSGPLSTVAGAVMAANARTKEAELRVAMLKSEATSRNWLPSLGPKVSLTSLGSIVASLAVEQTLVDNGRKKAERAVSRADVEVAAVALSQSSNARVQQALELYLDAEAADARARIIRGGLSRMTHFEWVMSERVRGGINNRADLQVVSQKLSRMRSDLATAEQRAISARSELSAMMNSPLSGVSGLSAVGQAQGAEPLSVLKARAESRRAMALADAARAGFLPGLSIGASIGTNGVDFGLNAGIPNGLSLGTGANLKAIEAQKDAAAARVDEAVEDSQRKLRALEGRLAETERKAASARGLADQANQNYRLFDAQLEAGRRAVPDVVGVYETKLRTAREASDLSYEVTRLRVQIAALKGALVSGERV